MTGTRRRGLSRARPFLLDALYFLRGAAVLALALGAAFEDFAGATAGAGAGFLFLGLVATCGTRSSTVCLNDAQDSPFAEHIPGVA